MLDYLVDTTRSAFTDGHIDRLTGPGLGIEVDEAAVARAAEIGHDWHNRRSGVTTAPSPSGERPRRQGRRPGGDQTDGVVAILRASTEAHVARATEALLAEGIDCIEVTATTPSAFPTVVHLAERFPSAILGLGTVTDRALAERALASGARYLVTPSVERDVIELGVEQGVPVVAGALTPTEILAAWRAGADIVKVFPVGPVGGPDYIRALRGPLPEIRLAPTGGVELADVGAYLRGGCVCVGLGSPLLGDALAGGSLAALRDRARRVVEAVTAAREGA